MGGPGRSTGVEYGVSDQHVVCKQQTRRNCAPVKLDEHPETTRSISLAAADFQRTVCRQTETCLARIQPSFKMCLASMKNVPPASANQTTRTRTTAELSASCLHHAVSAPSPPAPLSTSLSTACVNPWTIQSCARPVSRAMRRVLHSHSSTVDQRCVAQPTQRLLDQACTPPPHDAPTMKRPSHPPVQTDHRALRNSRPHPTWRSNVAITQAPRDPYLRMMLAGDSLRERPLLYMRDPY